MDRDSLKLLLDQGLSLSEIGRRFGRDESTVGYWVRKHGLQAVNVEKHSGKGGLARDRLELLIAEGLSVRDIGRRTGLSPSAVRYWLAKHGLKTGSTRRREDGRQAKADGRAMAEMECARHGLTAFWLEGRGAYRCLKCRRERVAERRRRVKRILVAEAGGRCALCGYDRFAAALRFHHVDPATKTFAIGQQGVTRGIATMREEAAKCVLLCANCHAAVEADLLTLDSAADKVVDGFRRSSGRRSRFGGPG